LGASRAEDTMEEKYTTLVGLLFKDSKEEG
jgi:hypothetical protein